MSLLRTKGATNIEVSEGKERVKITTLNGDVFEIVIADNEVQVFASTHFGAGLVVKPGSNNKITLTQDKI